MVERYFQQYAIVDQDILGSKESVDKVLALLPEDILSFPVVLSQYQYFSSLHQYQSNFSILGTSFGTISKKYWKYLTCLKHEQVFIVSNMSVWLV